MPKSRPIQEIVKKLELPEEYFEQIGPYGGKVRLELLKDQRFPRKGKLILVTATTPTASGEGKTVTAIGLTQGLCRIGKKAIITSREPSLGPVFGMKGGAAGGGASTLEPSSKINLHFHGDFHAIATAHNLLSALVDAHLFHGNELGLDPERISWPRTMDMNDRALRDIIVSAGSKKEGAARRTGFVITAASEIMAIIALSRDRTDLRLRLERIVVGVSRSGKPVTAGDLHAVGAMMALLTEAIQPNLVQTSEGTPAFVHAGPFGNIAHGTSSILSQDMGLRLADYVVNECGFAADLGAEKYMDIVYRTTGVAPSLAVLVTTVQSLRNQGAGDLEKGLPNLAQHLKILRSFGLPVVVAINRFPNDTDEDLQRLARYCVEHGATSALSEAYAKGGAGAEDLARTVVKAIDDTRQVSIQPVYSLQDSLETKVQGVAQKIYGASTVAFSEKAQAKLRQFSEWGFAGLPVCIAKTQYSLSDDPKRMGAPVCWTLNVTDAALSAGAGFIVVISGNMMLMPGLPKSPRAMEIDVDPDGAIIGA
ncbi:MAG TPA: formate--tetrahydrofolate ligase [Candidatus Acidoferrum sp.]